MIADVVEPARQRMDDPDRAAVGDHEHGLVGVLLEHVREEGGDALAEGREGLGVVGARRVAGEPAGVRVGEDRLDLGGGQAFPRTEGALPQARIELDGQSERGGDDLRGLARPGQVAGIHDVDVSNFLCDPLRLLAARVVQMRVRMTLPASVAVPVRFAVADEEKGGHETD